MRDQRAVHRPRQEHCQPSHDDVISKSRHLSHSAYPNTLKMHKVNPIILINQTFHYYSDGIDLKVKRFYLYSRVSLQRILDRLAHC